MSHPGCTANEPPTRRLPEDVACRIRAFFGPRRAKGEAKPPGYKQQTCSACGWRYWISESNHNLQCRACIKANNHRERVCRKCNGEFVGWQNICKPCRTVDRQCEGCGRTWRGTMTLCGKCQATDRTCAGCSRTFKGKMALCSPCRTAAKPPCSQCGGPNRSAGPVCNPCYWQSLDPAERAARKRRYGNARRARKRAAEVAGPVPASVYRAVVESGPCVYCTAPADTVDHVVPLARGGHEHESNLVPACASCNDSKCARLLNEWDQQRVAYAVATNPQVRAAWVALVARYALAA